MPMDVRQFIWRSNYIAGLMEKDGYTLLVSVTPVRRAESIHIYAVNAERALIDAEFNSTTLEKIKERRVESLPSKSAMIMNYIADILEPYSYLVPLGFLATGDHRGALGGAAVATLFSFRKFVRQNRKLADYFKDDMAWENYEYWLENSGRIRKNSIQSNSSQSPQA